MNKTAGLVLGAVVIAGISFWGGMQYGASTAKSANGAGARQGQFGNGTGRTGMRGAGAGGFVTGQVIAKDTSSITIKLRDGGSQILLLGGSTIIMKATTGTLADLAIGSDITATGASNSDGSLTAQSIQLRPAGFASSTPAR